MRSLLGRGFLPRELPPIISSFSFGEAAASLSTSASVKAKEWSAPAQFSIVRAGGLRRSLSIPNPQAQFRLARLVEQHWDALNAHCQASPYSISTPIPHVANNQRALTPKQRFFSKPIERLSRRRGALYVLHSDVAQFYGSIYTHSIPWALNGKTVTKSVLHTGGLGAVLGNDLDVAVRSGQEGQTVGLPTGPDTSLLLAETLMSAVDLMVKSALGPRLVAGLRYVDDFELYFRSRAHAEDGLGALETACRHFGLSLNEAKTEISALPLDLEAQWRSSLHQVNLRTATDELLANDLVAFFNVAFRHRRESPNESVMSYALQKARSLVQGPRSGAVLADVALASLQFESAAFPYAIEAFADLDRQSVAWDRSAVAGVLNRLVREHAPLEHGFEVSWALWAIGVLALRLDARAAKAVAAMQDNVSLLVYLSLTELGLVSKPEAPARFSMLESSTVAQRTDDWLLAYESTRQGWLAVPGVLADPFMSQMLKAKVSFLTGFGLGRPDRSWNKPLSVSTTNVVDSRAKRSASPSADTPSALPPWAVPIAEGPTADAATTDGSEPDFDDIPGDNPWLAVPQIAGFSVY